MPTTKELKERKRDVAAQERKLKRELERGHKRLEALRHAQEVNRRRHKDKAERLRELERAIAEQLKQSLWTKRACLDDCTTWSGLKLVLVTVAVKTDWTAVLSSADRTSHADDCGDKLSQAELYYGWTHHLPGFAPANPPGTGTHEGICDDDFAALTKFDIGDNLPHWAWGLDVGDGDGFVAGAHKLGFKVARPYGNEPWHINLTADPTARLKELHAL